MLELHETIIKDIPECIRIGEEMRRIEKEQLCATTLESVKSSLHVLSKVLLTHHVFKEKDMTLFRNICAVMIHKCLDSEEKRGEEKLDLSLIEDMLSNDFNSFLDRKVKEWNGNIEVDKISKEKAVHEAVHDLSVIMQKLLPFIHEELLIRLYGVFIVMLIFWTEEVQINKDTTENEVINKTLNTPVITEVEQVQKEINTNYAIMNAI